MKCPPGGSTLHHLNFINVNFGVGAPNWGGIFHQRTDKCLVKAGFWDLIFLFRKPND